MMVDLETAEGFDVLDLAIRLSSHASISASSDLELFEIGVIDAMDDAMKEGL